MAYNSNNQYIPGLLAGADLSAWQYKPVRMCSTAGEVNKVVGSATGTTAGIVGILHNDPADGEEALVADGGVSIGVCGTGAGVTQAQVHAGAALSANSTGLIVTTLANTAIVGYALEAATASGDEISVALRPGRY